MIGSEVVTLHGLALYGLIFGVATLYAAVGHGGASGYLAVMSALTSMAPFALAGTALVLNLLVAGVAFWQYHQAGHFDWRLTWPFLVISVPAAFVGGLLPLKATIYYALLVVVLLFAAGRMLWPGAKQFDHPSRPVSSPPSRKTAMTVGGGIGLLSGMVGVGGGIFLSPLMLMKGWADPKRTSATAAAFIVANSAAGLLGRLFQPLDLPPDTTILVGVGLAGGMLGAFVGAHFLRAERIRQVLGLVLLVAVIKMLGRCF